VRAARAEIDLNAVAHNVGALLDCIAPARLCAVVKADGYGHGAIAVGEAALEAGAEWLGVALVEEGAVLRKNGITAPILLLSQPRRDVDAAVRYGLRITVYDEDGIDAVASAARAAETTASVHLKVDTGMHRVGCRPGDALTLAKTIASRSELHLEAMWTHCAVADEPDNPFTERQIHRFDDVVQELERAGLRPPMLHAANSAAAMAHEHTRYDMVRCGIAVYGIAPSPALAGRVDLRPAMTLRAEVAMVKRVAAGEGISYGHRYHTSRETTVATVPIGYADGVPRRLSLKGGEVLIGGRRRPMVGVVTMDQFMVDCGDDEVAPGDEVVLIGSQGDERITADEWASRLDTIAYEVVCGIGPRVPRLYR
jgi:alanine racemase